MSNTLPQFPLLYGIPGYGYSFQERSLGGSPVLSPLPIFRITADVDGPLYLKTDVFDHYDGKNWKTTFRSEDTHPPIPARFCCAGARGGATTRSGWSC